MTLDTHKSYSHNRKLGCERLLHLSSQPGCRKAAPTLPLSFLCSPFCLDIARLSPSFTTILCLYVSYLHTTREYALRQWLGEELVSLGSNAVQAPLKWDAKQEVTLFDRFSCYNTFAPALSVLVLLILRRMDAATASVAIPG